MFLPSRRKSRAKRARESRKATQPVPQNLMEQLKKGTFDQESDEDRGATAKVGVCVCVKLWFFLDKLRQ